MIHVGVDNYNPLLAKHDLLEDDMETLRDCFNNWKRVKCATASSNPSCSKDSEDKIY